MKTQDKTFVVKTGERGGVKLDLSITIEGYPADSVFVDAFGEHSDFAQAMFNDGLLYRSKLATLRQSAAEDGMDDLIVAFADLAVSTPRGGPSKSDVKKASELWATAKLDALEDDTKRADRIRAWAAREEGKHNIRGLADLVPEEVSDSSVVAEILKRIRTELDRRAKAAASTTGL